MPSVTFLGTGPGTVASSRGQSSILLQTGVSSVLLDAGEPCSRSLLDLGFSLADLDAVLITHGHADHIGGLPLLLQAIASHGGADALRLGLPAHLQAPLEAWLRLIFLPLDGFKFSVTSFPWQAGVAVTVGDVVTVPRPNTHLDTWKKSGRPEVESFLFDVTCEGKRLVYSGDLGAPADLLPVINAPIDLLVCELAHFSAEELAAVLKPAQIGALCLTHLSREAGERRAELDLFFARELPDVADVYLPDDGERIEF